MTDEFQLVMILIITIVSAVCMITGAIVIVVIATISSA